MALMTARAATGRSRAMVFEGAYHGGVLTFATPINMQPLRHGVDLVGHTTDSEDLRDATRLPGMGAGRAHAVVPARR